ncbi:cupredoxin domain-containing protein [Alicyclobacillus dauci]|uniref:Cupredoxin domain-containing protein n=1 Tax=Alicyclobacillus dauci TaxID=1475485 RepID=A0ABY6Z092_9BACL|nr:cupredoxin domain-containing protein [Alicyclobacillus dauci]WAH35781.1 cupredoxin domain-containing protein [Alicyclobacillus dauci]
MRATLRCSMAFVGILAILPISLVHAQTIQVNLQDGSIRPAQIQAVKGKPLHIVVANRGQTVHNFVVPDFFVFSPNLQPGGTTDVRFTPDKTGSFRYYSDKKGIPEPGMEGQLVVR